MSTATGRGIYGKLAGDTTLNNMLHSPPPNYSKSIFYEIAPEAAQAPYVIMQKQAGTPTYGMASTTVIDEEVWLIKAVDHSTSPTLANDISARLNALLTDGALSISGKTQLYLRRESDVDYSESPAGSGERFIHSGSLYRLIVT